MKAKIGKYPRRANRRINIQIDRWDTYSLDHTLALIIYPALIQLKEEKHGVPGEFADVGGEDHACQDSFDFYKDTNREAFEQGCKRWDDILDKMIWSFQQIAFGDDYDDRYHHGKGRYSWEPAGTLHNPLTGKVEDTFRMVDENPDEHWYDHVGHMEHEKRIQEGLELFGKYYRNLWD
jgi:hypothetical protein